MRLYYVKETKGITGLVPGAAGVASHAGVFRGARFSSLKMHAWEATAGVVTYKIFDEDLTLAVMFLQDTLTNTNFVAALYNVKVYPGLDIKANADLYFNVRR